MSDYTVKRLEDIPDMGAQFGYAEIGEARFGRRELGASETGFAWHRFKPGKRSAFGHRHVSAEEIAVVVEGSGRLKADDDVIEVERHQVIRLGPSVMRAWEGGEDGMTVLVFGPHHDADGEMDEAFWPVEAS